MVRKVVPGMMSLVPVEKADRMPRSAMPAAAMAKARYAGLRAFRYRDHMRCRPVQSYVRMPQ